MRILPLNEIQIEYLKERQLLKKFQKCSDIFENNPHHPSLNTEVLEPKYLKIYSFRIDKKYRAVFIVKDGLAEIINITNHYK